VKGSLTIHGVTRETEANGTLEVKGASVTAKTKFVVKLGDYGISSKKIGKNIAETIAITVDCRYE
jgi:polyisoprenoid-binding protein YceI